MEKKHQLTQAYVHYNALRHEMSRWLEQSIKRDGPDRHEGGEDEANYALAFFPHYLLSGDEQIAERFRSLAADLKHWVATEGHLGYQAEAEAHHGTEPFLLFLPRYLGLFPQDKEAIALLADAAQHIGNWGEGAADWYDWQRDVFLSYRIGTKIVGGDAVFERELAEHFRFVHIALAAYRVTGETHYRDWALRYGQQRAARLLVGDGPLPVLWDLEGRGLQPEDLRTREEGVMAASNHHLPGDPLAGNENLLASGAVYALGDLFLLSGDEIFRDAARRIVEPLIGELLDPYADPAAAALSHYRWIFADTSLDSAIGAVLAHMPAESTAPWAMIFPQDNRRREPGVGKRGDMIYWGQWADDGSVQPVREPSTATLVLGYQLTGEVSLARRALAAAAAKLMIARRVLRGGREHADMGGAICSVAAGHGRNWGCGAVTGCYGPLLLGTRELQSAVVPLLEWEEGYLPEQLLSLVRPPVDAVGEVLFFNGGDQPLELVWRLAGTTGWHRVRLTAGEMHQCVLGEKK